MITHSIRAGCIVKLASSIAGIIPDPDQNRLRIGKGCSTALISVCWTICECSIVTPAGTGGGESAPTDVVGQVVAGACCVEGSGGRRLSQCGSSSRGCDGCDHRGRCDCRCSRHCGRCCRVEGDSGGGRGSDGCGSRRGCCHNSSYTTCGLGTGRARLSLITSNASGVPLRTGACVGTNVVGRGNLGTANSDTSLFERHAAFSTRVC